MPQVADADGMFYRRTRHHDVLTVLDVGNGRMPDTVATSHFEPAEHATRQTFLVFGRLLQAGAHMGEVYFQQILMLALH